MTSKTQLLFEKSIKGRKGSMLATCDVDTEIDAYIPQNMQREEAPELPELSEVDVIRHYVNLSKKNYSVDEGFYPLGSCTMKYNPKINEDMAGLAGFSHIHPDQDPKQVQGALHLMHRLGEMLSEITGMDGFTLQPAAGAHGELTGLMMIKAYHEHNGDMNRKKIIVPDSAHGTNPASASVAGFDVIEVSTDKNGNVDMETFKSHMNDELAGLMLTNPSTLGLFETQIIEIAQLVHEAGGLLYYDGANMNANLGISRPGDMGFDVIHLNLHKTFSTPHGGGGPGAGPVGVKKHLLPYLPVPVIREEHGHYTFDSNLPKTIGKVRSYYGNFGILVRAYTYILSLGFEGLKEISEMAVLSANYLQAMLKDDFYLPYDRFCKHEFVFSGLGPGIHEVSTLDIAKRLIDYGVHPPTIYFPIAVAEAMMVEPTESENLATLDYFIDCMKKIRQEVNESPELLKEAPHNTHVRRIDEVKAARQPVLRWKKVE